MSCSAIETKIKKPKYKNVSPAKKIRNLKRLLTFLLNKSPQFKSASSLEAFSTKDSPDPPQQTMEEVPEIEAVANPTALETSMPVPDKVFADLSVGEFREMLRSAFKPP